MLLKHWLRGWHKLKRLWQRDIVEDAGGAHSPVSQAENGSDIRTSETHEEPAEALTVTADELPGDGEEVPGLPNLPGRLSAEEIVNRSIAHGKSTGKKQKQQK